MRSGEVKHYAKAAGIISCVLLRIWICTPRYGVTAAWA